MVKNDISHVILLCFYIFFFYFFVCCFMTLFADIGPSGWCDYNIGSDAAPLAMAGPDGSLPADPSPGPTCGHLNISVPLHHLPLPEWGCFNQS